MNEPKDSKLDKPDAPPEGQAPAEGKSTGRVTFDTRGNSAWEWQLETGVYSRDVSTLAPKKPAQPKRRSLDDLRRLSEMIKAQRSKGKDQDKG